MRRLSFAIVGGGPAGFYTAKLLAKMQASPIVHVYERELCPFGLIRHGVAPDHQAIKRVENTLSEVASYSDFRYFGGYAIDQNALRDLRGKYSGVIFAYGCSGDHRLPFDDMTARQLVYWYNSHPQAQSVSLDGKERVTIIGNGNVAIDVARILLREPSELAVTDISDLALQELRKKTVKSVTVVGRRGIAQASFSVKEIREFKNFDIELCALKSEVSDSLTNASITESTDIGNNKASLIRSNRRKLQFMHDHFKLVDTPAELEKLTGRRRLAFRFLLSPTTYQQGILSCSKNKLIGDIFQQRGIATDERSNIPTNLLISSIGFKAQPLDAACFDEKRGSVGNENGCVVRNGKVDIGLYTVGWSKTGARGVIDNTLLECEETLNNIRIHLENGLLEPKPLPPMEIPHTLSFEAYQRVREV